MSWYEIRGDGALIRLWVQPKSSKNLVVGLFGTPPRLKLRIKAPPVEGRANEEVIEFLSSLLTRPRSAISLIRGETSRQKDVFCQGLTEEVLLAKLRAR